MKKLLLAIGIVSIFFITGCSNNGYIQNGKYYNDSAYYKVDGENIEFIDEANLIEAYGTYSVENDIITITYTFRNGLDSNSDEYGNVIPYMRVDTLHLEEDKLVLDKITIDGVEENINKTFTLK